MLNKGDQYTRITNLLSNGHISQGTNAMESARSTMPLPVFLECLGNLHFYKREFQQAIIKYEEAMKVDADYDAARYHYLIGVQKERENDLVEAFKRYQAAIEIESTFPDAYVELGGLLVKVEDYDGALKCYTDALKLDSTDLKNFSNRVYVLKLLSGVDPKLYAQEYQDALSKFENAKVRLPAPYELDNW